MQELTSKERIGRILRREPVDRIGLFESFWGDTQGKWTREGHIQEGEDLADHFGLEIRGAGWLNMTGNLDKPEEIVEETEETKLVRNPDGALLRWWKHKAGTPEHVDFLVQDRAGWNEHVRPYLLDENNYRRRINFEQYRQVREKCEKDQLYFTWGGVNVFELMHPMCGHEYMLIGMALDPEWVKDMCDVYSKVTVDLLEILFAEEGAPDGIWFCEDMGFKQKPFMSPAMYKEIVWPAHKRTFEFAHSKGLPVIVHSCGYVEPLVPGLIEAGMDCLQAMEVKAGMDLPTLKKAFGDRIAFIGGMDIRTLESNDQSVVLAELEKKLPTAMAGSGYCLGSDHSVSDRVEYETYKFFVDRGLEMGTY